MINNINLTIITTSLLILQIETIIVSANVNLDLFKETHFFSLILFDFKFHLEKIQIEAQFY